MEIEKLYKSRFDEKDQQRKNRTWEVLCHYFFQKYVPRDSISLDIVYG